MGVVKGGGGVGAQNKRSERENGGVTCAEHTNKRGDGEGDEWSEMGVKNTTGRMS